MSADEQRAVESLVGRTIVAAKSSKTDHEWVCELTMDDGRVVAFSAWGYDEWDATIDETTSEPEE